MPAMKWALVGASDVGATRMLPAMRQLGHKAVTVYSSVLPHATQYAQREGIPTPTDRLDRAFEGADAAYISTQNPMHGQHARAALEAGLHVLCEKPMTLDLDEAVELIALAQERQLTLAVNHHLPCSPVIRTLARLTGQGAIGELLGLRINHAVYLPERLRTWRIQDLPGAGVILDVTVHDAAVIDLLVGRAPQTATALTAHQGPWPLGAVDAVMSVLRWDDDLLAQTHDAFAVPHNETTVDLHGTEGSLLAINALTQDPVGEIVLRDRQGTRSIDVGPRDDLYVVSVARFAEAVAGDGSPAVTAVRGTQAVATALAVEEAARTGNSVTVVHIPRIP